MPGPSSRNDRVGAAALWLSVLLLALGAPACRPGGGDRGASGTAGDGATLDGAAALDAGLAASDSLALESTLSFRGWRGEEPILREETLLPGGTLLVSYLAAGADGTCTPIAGPPAAAGDTPNLPADPQGLQPGRALVKEGEIREDGSQLAVAEQPDAGGPDLLVVELQLAGNEGPPLLRRWELDCALAPILGESGPEYEPVSVHSATVSPAGGRLLVGLRGGGLPPYLLLDLSEGGGGAFLVR